MGDNGTYDASLLFCSLVCPGQAKKRTELFRDVDPEGRSVGASRRGWGPRWQTKENEEKLKAEIEEKEKKVEGEQRRVPKYGQPAREQARTRDPC